MSGKILSDGNLNRFLSFLIHNIYLLYPKVEERNGPNGLAGECEAMAEEINQLKLAGEDARTERDANLACIARLESQLIDLSSAMTAVE